MSIANPYTNKHGCTCCCDGSKLKKQATYASVFVASVLIIAKLFAYISSDSVSILSSLMDSTLDLLASIVMLISVRLAMEPADKKHRFGHAKLESLAALAQAVFITGSAVLLFYETLLRFIKPRQVENPELGVSVMLLSIVMTLFLVIFQRYVIKKTKSVAIGADSLHYKGDLLMNVGVIAALVLTKHTGWSYFDPIFALIISGILLHGAWQIGQMSFDILMDTELSDETRDKIKEIVNKNKNVHSIHDLRTRHTGKEMFIEFHLELDGKLNLIQAHDITEELELEIYKEFPDAEIIIHQEPEGIDDHRLDDLIEDKE